MILSGHKAKLNKKHPGDNTPGTVHFNYDPFAASNYGFVAVRYVHNGDLVTNHFPAKNLQRADSKPWLECKKLPASAPSTPLVPAPASAKSQDSFSYDPRLLPTLTTSDACEVSVPGDGNCAFYATAWYLGGKDGIDCTDHVDFRRAAVEYLDKHRDEFQWVFLPEAPFHQQAEGSIDKYLDLYRVPCKSAEDPQWADEMLLRALANRFNIIIVSWEEILNKEKNRTGYKVYSKICPTSGMTRNGTRILNMIFDGEHYNVLQLGLKPMGSVRAALFPPPTADGKPATHDLELGGSSQTQEASASQTQASTLLPPSTPKSSSADECQLPSDSASPLKSTGNTATKAPSSQPTQDGVSSPSVSSKVTAETAPSSPSSTQEVSSNVAAEKFQSPSPSSPQVLTSLSPIQPLPSTFQSLMNGKKYPGLGELARKTKQKAIFSALPVPFRTTDYYFAAAKDNEEKSIVRVGDWYVPTTGTRAGTKNVVVAIVRDKKTANDSAVIVPFDIDPADPNLLYKCGQVKMWTNRSYFCEGDSKSQFLGCLACDAYMQCEKDRIKGRPFSFGKINLLSAEDENNNRGEEQTKSDASPPAVTAAQKRARALRAEGSKFATRKKRQKYANVLDDNDDEGEVQELEPEPKRGREVDDDGSGDGISPASSKKLKSKEHELKSKEPQLKSDPRRWKAA